MFRSTDIVCNGVASLGWRGRAMSGERARATLHQLNEKRLKHQEELARIGSSHGHACMQCAGKCCGGEKRRDKEIDRLLHDTFHQTPELDRQNRSQGYCPRLTSQGCQLPYQLRPMQCTAYYCKKTAKELSRDECRQGAKAIRGLMAIQLKASLLPTHFFQA